jgi:hypothetical protein
VYQHLLSKFNEAEIKVTAVQAANFIQVIQPAYPPEEPGSSWPKLAVLAFAGSLGLGVMLAFLLQYISDFRTMDLAAPEESGQKTPSRKRTKKVTKSQGVTEQEKDRKTPLRVQIALDIWERLKKRFRGKNSSQHEDEMSPSDPDAEQEAPAVQDQHASKETETKAKNKTKTEAETVTEAKPDEGTKAGTEAETEKHKKNEVKTQGSNEQNDDQKVPSYGDAFLELQKRFRSIFRGKNSPHEHGDEVPPSDPDTEQEAPAVQDQHASKETETKAKNKTKTEAEVVTEAKPDEEAEAETESEDEAVTEAQIEAEIESEAEETESTTETEPKAA